MGGLNADGNAVNRRSFLFEEGEVSLEMLQANHTKKMNNEKGMKHRNTVIT